MIQINMLCLDKQVTFSSVIALGSVCVTGRCRGFRAKFPVTQAMISGCSRLWLCIA